MITVNLADYIDEEMNKIQKLPIDKCPDKAASLEFKITCQLISVIQGSENMSTMSGFNDLDVDSDPETEFRFENIDKEESKEKPQFRRRVLKSVSGFKKESTAPIVEEEKNEDEPPSLPKKMNKLKILSSNPAEE